MKREPWYYRLSCVIFAVFLSTINAHCLRIFIIEKEVGWASLSAINLLASASWAAFLFQREVNYREEHENDRPRIV